MTTEEPRSLPRGWCLATIPDLIAADGVFTDGDWVESKDQDPEGSVRLTQLADVGVGHFRDRSRRYLTKQKAEELRCTYLKEGDVLVARMPDPLGRACLFPKADQPCVTVVDVCVVRPGEGSVNRRWLMHFINSPHFRATVASYQSGTTRKRISRKNLSRINFPIPPLPEQTRIAEEMDAAWSKLDAAVAGLERAQANLKRYRASALQSAVEGRLVPTEAELAREEGRDYEPAEVLLDRILTERRQRWEDAELERLNAKGKSPTNDNWRSKYKEPVAPAVQDLPELPEGWCWSTLAQLSWDSSYGTSKKCSYDGDGEPVLRIPNVRNGKPTLDDMKYSVVSLELREDEHLAPGDFLIIRTNGSRNLIARAAFVQEPLPGKCFFASYLIRYRLVQASVVGRWLLALWHSPGMRQKLESRAATSAGQYNVSQSVLSKIPVPLPPKSEQVRIGAEVEHLMAVVDEEQRNIADNLVRCERLRQSVLSWAFTGKLVDQDSTEESASLLLSRIREERGMTSRPTNSRRRALRKRS